MLLELARACAPSPSPGVRVILLSTGAEESFMEGMRGFVARHGRRPGPRAHARGRAECVGGPEAIVLEGEGMLRMRDYTPATRDWLAAAGERAGHPLRRGLRSGFATDALIALKAGLPTAVLASIDAYKMAANSTRRTTSPRTSTSGPSGGAEVCAEAVRTLCPGGQLPCPLIASSRVRMAPA